MFQDLRGGVTAFVILRRGSGNGEEWGDPQKNGPILKRTAPCGNAWALFDWRTVESVALTIVGAVLELGRTGQPLHGSGHVTPNVTPGSVGTGDVCLWPPLS